VNELAPREPVTDERAIGLWLSRYSSPETRRAYSRDVVEYLQVIGKPLAETSLAETIAFSDYLARYQPSTKSRKIGTIKSLHKFLADPAVGYLRSNPWSLVRWSSPSPKAEHRILTESEVMRLLVASRTPRQRAVLDLLYYGGMRAAEVRAATWNDLEARPDIASGQISIHGKGSKTRVTLLPPSIWTTLNVWGQLVYLGDPKPDAPIVPSQKGGPISVSAIWRVVRVLALKAGIDKPVSPHWLRHCHATHAIHRGCPIELVADDLGHESLQTTRRYIHRRPTQGSALYLPV